MTFVKTTHSMKDSLAVVMLVYNEADVIEGVLRDYYKKVTSIAPKAEFIIAEDGSTDGTKEILARLEKELHFTLISGRARKGYTAAFQDALAIPKAELILFSDSDGQQEPLDLSNLLKEMDEVDIVGGYKLNRHDPTYRIFISRVYNVLIRLLFGLKMKDIDSGFKLIKRTVIDDILKEPLHFKYCVMSEFILKAYLLKYKIKEVPIRHYARKSGKSAIFMPRLLPGIIVGLIKDLFMLKSKYTKKRCR